MSVTGIVRFPNTVQSYVYMISESTDIIFGIFHVQSNNIHVQKDVAQENIFGTTHSFDEDLDSENVSFDSESSVENDNDSGHSSNN